MMPMRRSTDKPPTDWPIVVLGSALAAGALATIGLLVWLLWEAMKNG